MAVLPCVLFSAADVSDAKDLIKQLLDIPELVDNSDQDFPQYEWKVDTKYYTAQVGLCAVSDQSANLCRESPESIQSLILYFDAEEEKSFQFFDKWLPFLAEHKPEVLIAVCRHCSDFTAIPRMTILNWCIENGFELVELKPDLSDEEEEEDDFPETVGVARIIQALHAHTWPNLVMKKDGPSFCQSYLSELMAEDVALPPSTTDGIVNNEHNQDICLKRTSDSTTIASCPDTSEEPTVSLRGESNNVCTSTNNYTKTDDQSSCNQTKPDNIFCEEDLSMFAALGSEDADQGSFEVLFEKLQVMKEKAQYLPHNQRKQYAEKMAVSFWKAIGGDADEIDGLSDTDEES
ncbi:AAGAB [Acanthosepion pharaonis]|uniref:AAGAB n=1 Tax=Acanthosepion pharaonis TaxID=158019 RepID=A0A812AYK6_ACAPH|nr:AAGAB [Sepia pharaonis]